TRPRAGRRGAAAGPRREEAAPGARGPRAGSRRAGLVPARHQEADSLQEGRDLPHRRAVAALDAGRHPGLDAPAEDPPQAGALVGRLFFNVAGIGLDARVAHRFAVNGLVRRGFTRYIEMTLRELFSYVPDEHTIATDTQVSRVRALMIAIANGRQYGNGAVI